MAEQRWDKSPAQGAEQRACGRLLPRVTTARTPRSGVEMKNDLKKRNGGDGEEQQQQQQQQQDGDRGRWQEGRGEGQRAQSGLPWHGKPISVVLPGRRRVEAGPPRTAGPGLVLLVFSSPAASSLVDSQAASVSQPISALLATGDASSSRSRPLLLLHFRTIPGAAPGPKQTHDTPLG